MVHESRPITVTGYANVNIALLKYWGKSDEILKLPHQSSISLTLEGLGTTSTITLDHSFQEDSLFFDGVRANASEEAKMIEYLKLVRKIYHCDGFVSINTSNSVPTAAGLASSASAFASIAVALNQIYQLNLNEEGLSKLARLGSGSAARSIYGGFSIWHHGDSHETSYASHIASTWDDLAFLVVLISKDKKKVSSREAMKKSVLLPSYKRFVMESEKLVEPILAAIHDKDLMKLGPLMEQSSNLLHATIRQAGVDYYQEGTKQLLSLLHSIKKKIPVFYTIDAGPNVKLLTKQAYVDDLLAELKAYEVIVTKMGKGAYVRD